MEKLVSIVLPVYNGEKYLGEAIESILAQTYKNFELIIVNDCSTDGTEEISLRYREQDPRIIYHKNAINSKLPKSLNYGFSVAKGDYYTWTSDDNRFSPEAIDTMVKFLELHSEIGFVYCDYNKIDEKGKIICKRTVGEPERILFDNVVGACFMYRRGIAEKIGEYDTNLFLVEDYEYWLRMNTVCKIAPLHMCLYEYREHGGSLTSTREKEIRDARGNLVWLYLKKYENLQMPTRVLFDYFDYALEYKDNMLERVKLEIQFTIRHPLYFGSLIKRLQHKFQK